MPSVLPVKFSPISTAAKARAGSNDTSGARKTKNARRGRLRFQTLIAAKRQAAMPESRNLSADRPKLKWGHYFASKSATSDFSSFNSFSEAVIFERLKSLIGSPGTISQFLPSLRIG